MSHDLSYFSGPRTSGAYQQEYTCTNNITVEIRAQAKSDSAAYYCHFETSGSFVNMAQTHPGTK